MRCLAALFLISACEGDESLTAYGAEGTWRLTHINEQPFEARATISFSTGGQVTGAAPCNSYRAQQAAPYPWFTLSPIMATKRACADLAAEQAYFAAMRDMTLAEVSGDVLILSNDAGGSLLFTKLTDG